VPEQWPEGEFDLIVLSELLYYFDADQRARLLRTALGSLADRGHLLAVPWRPHVPEHTAEADEIHGELRRATELSTLARHEEEDFLLDVFERTDRTDPRSGDSPRRALSAAALEGLDVS
jgi:hypothetical protein